MAFGNGVTLGPLTPRCRFYPASDQSAGARSLSRSGRNPLLDTAFHSPSAMTHLAASPRGRVNVPGLHLRSDSEMLSQPVRSRTPAPVWLFYGGARRNH